MIKFLSSLIVLVAMLLFTSFSCSEKTKAELLLEVVKININTWLNLMPGVSPGKFHLTGEVTLQNKSDEEINNISLNNVTVYSLGKVIYSFEPYFKNKMMEDNFNLKTGMTKVFRFGMAEGLKIDERLTNNRIVNIKLNFVSDKGNYSYSVDSVEVEEAY